MYFLCFNIPSAPNPRPHQVFQLSCWWLRFQLFLLLLSLNFQLLLYDPPSSPFFHLPCLKLLSFLVALHSPWTRLLVSQWQWLSFWLWHSGEPVRGDKTVPNPLCALQFYFQLLTTITCNAMKHVMLNHPGNILWFQTCRKEAWSNHSYLHWKIPVLQSPRFYKRLPTGCQAFCFSVCQLE